MYADPPKCERIANGQALVTGSASDGSAAGRTPRGVRAGWKFVHQADAAGGRVP